MNLAIVSTNKDTYSETFIHNHIKLLPAAVHLLFGGYLPTRYSTDKGLTDHAFKKETGKKWYAIGNSDTANENDTLIRSIETYLTESRIALILCEYGPSGLAMLPVSKNTGIPLVVHFHGYDAYRHDVLKFYGTKYPALFDHTKAVIGVSRHMCAQLQQLGCNAAKLHCLPYGIDTTLFYKNEQLKKEYTFVACGRFVEKKAPLNTIRAFKQVLQNLPEATMIMIGDGELLADCVALAEQYGIKHALTFTGALDQQQVADLFNRTFMFVQHSVTPANGDSEGTPLAILESAACGLPVISTRHGGIPDMIEDGETGFLVAEQDIEAMAEHMLFLAQQPSLVEKMGLKAAAKIRAGYDLHSYINQLWKLLQNCVEHS